MKIRNYTDTDLQACRALWAEMVQRHRDIYDDQSIGGDNPGLEFDGHLETVGQDNTWVAESGGEIVGFTCLIRKDPEAEIEPIVVSQKHRGKSIGERLLRHVSRIAKKNGILCLYAKPVARNKEAVAFFHHNGFDTVGHIQLFKWFGESDEDTWKPGLDIFGKPYRY